jgi:hypothetical protein
MAQGFLTIDGVDYNEVWYGLLPVIDRYNERDRTDIETILANRNDERLKKYVLKSSNGFKKLGEVEHPDRQKVEWGKMVKMTTKYGSAYGYDLDFLKDATADDIKRTQADILEQDREMIKSLLLETCLTNSTNGFYNAAFDTLEGISAPPSYGQNTFLSTHTHYITAGATTLSFNNCTTIRNHIEEHGAPSTLVGFINGEDSGNIVNAMAPTTSTVYVSNPLTDSVITTGLIGNFGGINWVRTALMPAGYVLVVGTNPGVDNQKPVTIIHPTNASFRGLKLIEGNLPTFPLINSYFLHWATAKVVHRGNGVACQLTANASYTDPTFVNSFA